MGAIVMAVAVLGTAGAALRAGFSSAGPEWIPGRYFPRFPSTSRIEVLTVKTDLDNQALTWRKNFRINQSYDTMMALTLAGMQGIINREKPSLYIDWIDSATNDASHFWVAYLEKQVEVVPLALDAASAIGDLHARHKSLFAGAVIYDPLVPDTINLATMIAGLENRVMLAPEQMGLPGIPSFSSVKDLRPLAKSQGWDTTETGKTKLYQWVYDNLWSRLEHRIIGIISGGPPTSGKIAGATGDYYYPLCLGSRDYYTALKLSALYLDPKDKRQGDLLAKFLGDAPAPAPVSGCYANDELPTTALISRYGGWNMALSWPNAPLQGYNLTVLSGVRPALKCYSPEISQDRILATLGRKPVATVWNTDGDNLDYQLDRGFQGGLHWVWGDLQRHRFGWTNNPTLVDLAPLVWNYYVGSRKEVRFVSGYSGAGYMYPSLMTNVQLDDYLKHAAAYLSQTGERVVWADLHYGWIWDQRLAGRYYGKLDRAGYLGAFTSASGPRWGLPFVYEGVPAPAAAPAYVMDYTNVDWIIRDIMARKPDEVFVDLNALYYSLNLDWGQVVKDPQAFGQDAYLVRHGNPQWGLVVYGPRAVFPPGDYTVAFRLKVPATSSPQDMAQIYVGRLSDSWPNPVWEWIARRYLAPNDFKAPNRYQEFALNFHLAKLTTQIEFRIDYRGTSTDLYVDFVRCRRRGSAGLPVLAPVLINLMAPPERMTDVPAFAEKFEKAGGITLTAEEFMAVLNPKYMLKLAEKLAGAQNPDVIKAKSLLGSGDFLGSLLASRSALRTTGLGQESIR
jgi:hypothetical protein